MPLVRICLFRYVDCIGLKKGSVNAEMQWCI